MIRDPDIEANITYFATANGGKTTPVHSGYRPTHNFGIPGMLNDAQHDYPDVHEVRPGETAKAFLTFLVPEYQQKRLFEGMTFTVQEGGRIVGHGTVSKVFNQELKR